MVAEHIERLKRGVRGAQARRTVSYACAFFTLTLLALSPRLVAASPWTLPKDELALSLNIDFQLANEEFLPEAANGRRQDFPLDGQFGSTALRLAARYGFTDRFEGAVDLSFKQVYFDANPVLVALAPAESPTLDGTRNQILNFAGSRAGAADFYFFGRYNLLRSTVLITTETALKLPAGYTPPEATFGAEGDINSTIEDDVTLGDGQVDLRQSLLFGTYVPQTRSFARLDLGVNFRFGAPGHQLLGAARIGQFVGDHIVLFGGVDGAWTFTDGEVLGPTFVARDPAVPASQFPVPGNVETYPLTLDKDWLSVVAGGILRFGLAEIFASYSQIVTGVNIPVIHSVTLGTVVAIPSATASK